MGEFFKEGFAFGFGQCTEEIGLEVLGDDAEFIEFFPSSGEQKNPVGAPVGLVGLALDPAGFLDALEQRRDGVGVAAHHPRELALREAGGVAFAEGAQHGKLIRRGAGVADAAAEGLVEPVPRASQKQRQSLAFGGVDGEVVVVFFGRHFGLGRTIVRTGTISALLFPPSKAINFLRPKKIARGPFGRGDGLDNSPYQYETN